MKRTVAVFGIGVVAGFIMRTLIAHAIVSREMDNMTFEHIGVTPPGQVKVFP